jgi:hypothetical protein
MFLMKRGTEMVGMLLDEGALWEKWAKGDPKR